MEAIIIGTVIAVLVTAANVILLLHQEKRIKKKYEWLAANENTKLRKDLSEMRALKDAKVSKLLEARDEATRYKEALIEEREGKQTLSNALMREVEARKLAEKMLRDEYDKQAKQWQE